MKKFKNKKIMLSFILIFIIGLALGISFIFYINDIDKIILSKEIEEYINIVNNKDFDYLTSFLSSIKINIIYLTIVWSIGILFIFFPIVYFIVFYKGFLIGFLFSSLIFIFKLKGIIYSIIFIFPHEILNIIILIGTSIISVKFGKMLFQKIKKNESINLKPIYKRYFITYIIFIILSIVSSILEVFVNSFLIKVVV